MQQRRQDESSNVLEWVDLVADTIFDYSGAILEVAFDVAAGVLEGAGSLVFSLLDIF